MTARSMRETDKQAHSLSAFFIPGKDHILTLRTNLYRYEK